VPLWMLREETIKDLSKKISAINIVALYLNGTMSVNARYRRLKERLIDGLDQVWKSREDTRILFSVTYFTAFLSTPTGTLRKLLISLSTLLRR
jgi:hypothetical protein